MATGPGDGGVASTFCSALATEQARFFGDSSACRNGEGAAVGRYYDVDGCRAGFGLWCSSSQDQREARDLEQCLRALPVCVGGESDRAYDAFLACAQGLSRFSSSCVYTFGPK